MSSVVTPPRADTSATPRQCLMVSVLFFPRADTSVTPRQDKMLRVSTSPRADTSVTFRQCAITSVLTRPRADTSVISGQSERVRFLTCPRGETSTRPLTNDSVNVWMPRRADTFLTRSDPWKRSTESQPRWDRLDVHWKHEAERSHGKTRRSLSVSL